MVEQMKPSGIDWIGDIPRGWKIRKNVTAITREENRDVERLPVFG